MRIPVSAGGAHAGASGLQRCVCVWWEMHQPGGRGVLRRGAAGPAARSLCLGPSCAPRAPSTARGNSASPASVLSVPRGQSRRGERRWSTPRGGLHLGEGDRPPGSQLQGRTGAEGLSPQGLNGSVPSDSRAQAELGGRSRWWTVPCRLSAPAASSLGGVFVAVRPSGSTSCAPRMQSDGKWTCLVGRRASPSRLGSGSRCVQAPGDPAVGPRPCGVMGRTLGPERSPRWPPPASCMAPCWPLGCSGPGSCGACLGRWFWASSLERCTEAGFLHPPGTRSPGPRPLHFSQLPGCLLPWEPPA